MRYFLELRYNGAAYCGWQRQPDQPSVQQTLERALATLLREPVALTGAGRTDTGVNAAYYVAHFDCERPVADPAQTVYKLNFLLPGDIAVGSMTPVAEDAHARFHAREREYRYFIEPRKNPFTRHETWQYYVPLDVGRMNEAAAMLTAYDDFTSFAKLNSNNKTNICRVKEAVWTIDSRGTMCFTIRADRFLRNMVRSLVGTLVDVGRGRYTPDGFRSIVESRDLSRSSAGAPAQGCFSRTWFTRRTYSNINVSLNSKCYDWNDCLADRPRVRNLVRAGHFQKEHLHGRKGHRGGRGAAHQLGGACGLLLLRPRPFAGVVQITVLCRRKHAADPQRCGIKVM